MDSPTFYAIIPANVRYSEIPPNAKLLYGEITALTNKTGECFATNGYFAELYKVKERQVQRWISNLSKSGFITVDFDDYKRKIRIVDGCHNGQGGASKKTFGYVKKDIHNNIYNNTNNIRKKILKKQKEEEEEKLRKLEGELIDRKRIVQEISEKMDPGQLETLRQEAEKEINDLTKGLAGSLPNFGLLVRGRIEKKIFDNRDSYIIKK